MIANSIFWVVNWGFRYYWTPQSHCGLFLFHEMYILHLIVKHFLSAFKSFALCWPCLPILEHLLAPNMLGSPVRWNSNDMDMILRWVPHNFLSDNSPKTLGIYYFITYVREQPSSRELILCTTAITSMPSTKDMSLLYSLGKLNS